VQARRTRASDMPKRLCNTARGDPAPKCRRDSDGTNDLRAVAEVLMQLDIPVQQVLKATHGSGLTKSDCNSDLTAFSRMWTPYGTVATTMEMPTTDGGTLTIHYNNPFSYLYAAATVNNAFGSFIHDHLTAKIDIWKFMDNDESTVKQECPERDDGQEKFTCKDCGSDKEVGQAYILTFCDDNADAEDEQKRNRKCTTLADLQGKSARCTDCHRLRTRLTTVLKRNSNVRGSWGEISKETKQQFMKDNATLMGDQLAKRMTEVVCEHKIHKQIAVLSECR
jgi:hypothetical protein